MRERSPLAWDAGLRREAGFVVFQPAAPKLIRIGVAPLVAWKFAITRFVFALVFIVLWGRTIERQFAKFGKRTPLLVVQAATYASVVAIWTLLVATESAAPHAWWPDVLSSARMVLIPELCWFAYESLRQRRMQRAVSQS